MKASPGMCALGCFSIGIAFAQSSPQKAAGNSVAASGVSFDRLAKQAEQARQGNRVTDAIALYKKAVALKPSWGDGWWNLGSLYYDVDDYTQGRDAFRRLATLDPKSGIAWTMLGLCEFQTRQYDLSLSHLGRGKAIGTGESENISDVARYHVALLLTRAADYEQALKELAVFAQRDRNLPDYVEAMGIAALRKPVLPSELPPTERELVMDVGRAMYDATSRKARNAESDFRLLLDKYPNQANIHYLYGTSLLNSDSDRALSEMKKELDLSPLHIPALVAIAAELLRSEDYKSALPYAEKAVEADANSFPAHAILGRILVEGNIDKPRGVKELELARNLEPSSPQVRIALASAYAKVGRNEEAAKERQEFQALRKQSDERSAVQP